MLPHLVRVRLGAFRRANGNVSNRVNGKADLLTIFYPQHITF